MIQNRVLGACPFCNVLFKSPGALANHLAAKHSDKSLPFKRMKPKAISGNQAESDEENQTSDVARGANTISQGGEARELYKMVEVFDSGTAGSDEIFTSDVVELVPYITVPDDSDVTQSDTLEVTTSQIQQFPDFREAGKALCAYKQRSLDAAKCHSPFMSAKDYKLARFFHSAQVPLHQIDNFFKEDFLQTSQVRIPTSHGFSFNSAYTLCQQWDKMTKDPQWKNGFVDFKMAPNTEFWYRDLLECIMYLLRRKSYAKNMLWSPVREFDAVGERVYTEMNTASWWWDTQVYSKLLPVFQTLTVF